MAVSGTRAPVSSRCRVGKGYGPAADRPDSAPQYWRHRAATAEADATHTRVCANDASHTETKACDFTAKVTQEATLDQAEITTYTCKDCGYSYTKETAPALAGVTVTVNAVENGSVTLAGQDVTAGGSKKFAENGTYTLVATPNADCTFVGWQTGNKIVSTDASYTTVAIADITYTPVFAESAKPVQFTFVDMFNNVISSQSVASGADVKIPQAPTYTGYTFTGWSGTGLTGEDNLTVTIPKGSTGNRSYTAHWRYNGGGSSGYSYYTIKATAGAGGSISPSGNVSVREGRDQTFTITPDKGYAVANVKIDGKSIGAVKSYTFENVSRTHTIEVIFMKANGNPQTGVFVDVATGSYYEDAVDWAVENGITQGTDDTHFSPDGICTRAQAVTFLWRAAGSPKPETRTMPFTDVPAGSYYYDAVLWAVENGITKGTSDTTFSPNMTCTRAQIVAFLWRSEKSPAAGTANPFADVKSTAYYADAVLWAVKENITKGTTSTTFSPNADCTRAQIVTFLWRCKK